MSSLFSPALLPALLLVCLQTFGSQARANIYEREANDDVIHITNFEADLATKLYLIDHAQKSISISSFSIGRDSFGVSVVRSLRKALDRGISVRIVYESMISRLLADDPMLLIENLLLDPALVNKAEIVAMKPLTKMMSELSIVDFVHQKLLIVDPGTEQSSVYFGGREIAAFASTTLDSGFLVRPLNPNQPYLGTSLLADFDLTWNILKLDFKVESAGHWFAKIAQHFNRTNYPEFTPSGEGLAAFRKVLPYLLKRPQQNEQLASFQFRPHSSQLITNALLARIESGMITADALQTPEVSANDDIIRTLTDMISKAKDVQIAAYSAAYQRSLLYALYTCLNADAKVRIYTDGESTMLNMDNISGNFAIMARMSLLSFYNSMAAMWEVKSLAHHPENLKVFGTEIAKLSQGGKSKLNYLHRKLILINSDTVVTGSHNYTESSATKNDEMIVIFKDPRMNQYFRDLNQREEAAYYTEVDPMNPRYYKDYTDHSVRRAIFNGLMKDLY